MPPARSEELIARGEYLVRAGSCFGCHTEPGGAPYAGGRAIETPFGIVNAPNLTADATGLAAWAARRLLARAAQRPRATAASSIRRFPYPNYTRLARADADAMFAYLKSLPPVAKKNRPHALRFPFDQQASLAVWRALFFRPAQFETDTARSRRSGTAAPTSSRRSATATRATRAATSSARRSARSTSPAA